MAAVYELIERRALSYFGWLLVAAATGLFAVGVFGLLALPWLIG